MHVPKHIYDFLNVNADVHNYNTSHASLFRVPLTRTRGTGMIASSSTFCPHPGRVIRDLFRQLHAVWHGTETLVYSNHPREAAASSYLAIIFGRIASGVPWFLRSTAVLIQLSHQCWRWCRLW